MMLNTGKKQFIAACGAISLGVLGNGIWDIAVKPSGYWILKTILNIVTLGSSAVKDSTYLEAAKGNHELSALALLTALASVILSLPIAFGLGLFKLRKRMKKLRDRSRSESDTTTISVDQKFRQIDLDFRIAYGLLILLLFQVGFIGVRMLMVAQSNSAYTFFRQEFAICRPYLDDKQAQLIESQFARIQTRADYIATVNGLRKVAEAHQIPLPKYAPW